MKDLLVILVFVVIALVGAARSSIFNKSATPSWTEADNMSSMSSGIETTGRAASSPLTDTPAASTNSSDAVDTTTAATSSVTTSSTNSDVSVHSTVSNTTDALGPVDDQPAGTIVTVKSVTFSAPGWVAVHEVDPVTHKPGTTKGATWLPAGTHANVKVEVVHALVAGKLYFVVLHSDNGDKKYNHVVDLPITSSIPYQFAAK